MITALLGTGHLPDFTGTILLLEDVQEPLYRIDRMLTQLKLAHVLDSVAGFVIGHFIDSEGIDLSLSVEKVLCGLIRDKAVPIISSYPHGHDLPNLTIPHGARVRLIAEPNEETVGMVADA